VSTSCGPGTQGLGLGDSGPLHAPYVLGVINLRGAIVPVIDLRIRLHLGQAPYGPATVIVSSGAGSPRRAHRGLVVDAMNSVHDIAPSAIRPPPSLPGKVDDRFLEASWSRGQIDAAARRCSPGHLQHRGRLIMVEVISLEPRLEIRDVEAVHRRLLDAVAGAASLSVDVSRVTAIDTAGAQLLWRWCARLNGAE